MAGYIQHQVARGFGNQGNATEDAKKKSWQDAMQAASAAALAAKADPQTMLGFAVGKLLSRYLFDNKGDNGVGGPTKKDNDIYGASQQGGNQSTNVTTPDSQMVQPKKGLLELSQMDEPYTGDWGAEVNVKKDFFSPKEIKDPMDNFKVNIGDWFKL